MDVTADPQQIPVINRKPVAPRLAYLLTGIGLFVLVGESTITLLPILILLVTFSRDYFGAEVGPVYVFNIATHYAPQWHLLPPMVGLIMSTLPLILPTVALIILGINRTDVLTRKAKRQRMLYTVIAYVTIVAAMGNTLLNLHTMGSALG